MTTADQKVRDYLIEIGSEGYVKPEWVRLLADDRYIMAKPLMFHWTVITGSLLNTFGYDDRWCFADQDLALKALAEWPEDPPSDYEPSGWHRHPRTHRRREAGDPALEIFAP